MNVDQFFEALPACYNPSAAAGLTKTIQWHITDADPGVWAFEIVNGEGRLVPGGVAEPDTTFTTDAETWIAIAEGRQDAMRAFMTGRLKVVGDTMLAMKSSELFEPQTA
ncbi:SCP2 sterol-binding domain-containing protein [Streptantibioticus rubrisoli]|uniref:SCP2 sterol-binding domain-containing protein n=1 Tax=Streptantibioticus rubrisoli TaxID=1387313 RepID=A0ABT1P6L2_9ACTN|nr:SCP2 sterol-binding domain-containing protein [Streptantibioticus rubrisoli]MCQ4041016.1 SCP2 sterol-binding domain-containing protein [Streptantibioticus rubrisoli]